MALGPIGNAIDIKDFQDKPFSGWFVGSRTFNTRIGEQTCYKFKGKDGKFFEVYGFTNLNRDMERVELGWFTQITYKGKKLCETKFGNKEVHQVETLADPDDILPSDPDYSEPLDKIGLKEGDIF